MIDGCGVCGGHGSSCAGCDKVPNSGKVVDLCGVCGGSGISSDKCNCAGDVLDECGVCGEVRVLDACGVCVDAGTRRGLRLYQDCGNADCLAETSVSASTHEVRITLSLTMSLSAITRRRYSRLRWRRFRARQWSFAGLKASALGGIFWQNLFASRLLYSDVIIRRPPCSAFSLIAEDAVLRA